MINFAINRKQKKMLSVYSYVEPHRFLKDAWTLKRKKNPAFSLTSWSKTLGFENSSPLSLALKGNRVLPKKYLPSIIKSLELTDQEGTYLEALFDLAKAKQPAEKLFYLNRLKKLSPNEIVQSQIIEEYKTLSEPVHTVLLEMTDLRDFKLDVNWIQSRLEDPISLKEISEVLERLINLKLISRDPVSGKIRKTHNTLTSPNDVADLASKNYHKAVSTMAAEAIFKQNLEDREFGSYTFNVKKSQMPKAKKMIREFFSNFFKEVEAPAGEGDETYQMNIQLFQMTHPGDSK